MNVKKCTCWCLSIIVQKEDWGVNLQRIHSQCLHGVYEPWDFSIQIKKNHHYRSLHTAHYAILTFYVYYNSNTILTLYLNADRHRNPNIVYSYRHHCAHFSHLRLTSENIRRSQLTRTLRLRSAAAHLLRLWVRIPSGAWMFFFCECYVLSGRGLCDGLVTRPEESYWLWCVGVCDRETLWLRRTWPTGGILRQNKQTNKQWQYTLYKSNKHVAPWRWPFLCPKHIWAINNKYCVTNWK